MWLDRKEIARTATKQFMKVFKRDNLNYLTQIGLLRSPFVHQLYSSLVPMLYKTAEDEYYGNARHDAEMTTLLQDSVAK